MKRAFIFTIFIIWCYCSFAQSTIIEYRKILNDGKDLAIKTISKDLYEKGQASLVLSLMYESSIQEDVEKSGYSLIMGFYSPNQSRIIPLNGKLLLKTSTDKVITLKQVSNDWIDTFDPSNGLSNYFSRSHYWPENRYRVVGKYPIRAEELKTLISEGIIKIRFETNGPSIDFDYPSEEIIENEKKKKEPNNLIGYNLSILYSAINNHLSPYVGF